MNEFLSGDWYNRFTVLIVDVNIGFPLEKLRPCLQSAINGVLTTTTEPFTSAPSLDQHASAIDRIQLSL